MTEQEKQQATALMEAVNVFVQTLTEYEIREILAGRKQITTVEACPRCRHSADNPWAHCKCRDEECGCSVAVAMTAGPSLGWQQGRGEG